MMVVLLMLLTLNDSLPPSPDLSAVVFPEPPLYRASVPITLSLGGFVGDQSGATGAIETRHFTAHVLYERKSEWDTIHSGYFDGSLDLFFDHFRFKPALSGFLLQHQHEYVYTCPRVDFSAPTPWAILWGQSSLDLWRIDGSHQFEHQTTLEVIFDKVVYKPQFEITGLYTAQRTRTEAAWNMHIRNVHVSLRSPLGYDFPSPSLTIQYRDPLLTVKGTVRSGAVYHSLMSYFDPDLPIVYTTAVPEESLRLSAQLTVAADLYRHVLRIDGSYDNWYNRLSVGDSFALAAVTDVQEFGVNLTARDSIRIRSLSSTHTLTVHYRWTDTRIPLLPEWIVQDSIWLRLALIDVLVAAQFRSQHDGIAKRLPATLRMNSELGMRIALFRLFFRINNVADTRDEWCDGFFLRGRQYAGGLELKHTF